jgi:multimeric flavodoxin WrbA
MYVLALNGSPRKGGNTEFLLNEVLQHCLEAGAEVECVHVLDVLKDGKNPYCVHCSNPCNMVCLKGTMVEETFDKMKRADSIILGSPVYFGTVSGILRSFWDKTRCLRGENALIGKIGSAVTSGNAVYGGQETTIRALHDMMLVQGMTIIADGATGYDAGHFGVSSSGKAEKHEFAKERAKILAERIMGR